jgi:hypothetical protein
LDTAVSDVLPPPPPPRSSSDGCWKWGAITCGGLGCLGVIAIVAMVAFVMRSPEFKKMMSTMQKATVVQRDMVTVKRALDQYKADKGKYPAKLKELVPKYLPNEGSLHLSEEPTGPEFVYTQPPKDAPASAIILQYDLPSPVPTAGAPPWTIRMRLDGQVEGMEYQYERGGGRIRVNPGGG